MSKIRDEARRLSAVFYLRDSSDKQRLQGTSIPAQRRECRAYCERKNYDFLDEYVDDGLTGQTLLRPGWRAMLEAAARKPAPFDVIVIYDTSRFDRTVYADPELEKIRERGIRVEWVTSPPQYNEDGELTPQSKLVERVQRAIDLDYVERLSETTRRGCREVALRGFRPGGPPPYGYRNGKRLDGSVERIVLEPDPERAPILAEIFRLKVEGLGNKAIRNRLNSRGIRGPRGSAWNENTIREITRNEVYLGKSIWGRRKYNHRHGGRRTSRLRLPERWIENPKAHEPLVTQDVFDRAQKQRRLDKPRTRDSARRVYVLSGRLFCVRCDRPATARPSNDRHKKSWPYYACASGKECGAPAVRAAEIEAASLDALLRALDDNQAVDAELRRFAQTNRGPEVRALEQRLTDIGRKAQNLLSLVERGDDDAQMRYLERKREQEAIRRELEALKQTSIRIPTLAQACSAIKLVRQHITSIEADPSQAQRLREIVHVLVTRISFNFHTREAEIRCRIPAAPSAAIKGLRESVIAGA